MKGLLKMGNYTISEKRKTIFIDLDKATEEDKEKVKFLAEINGYAVKIKNIKSDEQKANKFDKDFCIEYLKNNADAEKIETFNAECNKPVVKDNKKVYNKNGTIKVKGFLGGHTWFEKNYPLILKDAVNKLDNQKKALYNNEVAERENKKSFSADKEQKEYQLRRIYWKYYFM